jgi:hypothetical protein
VSSDPRTSKICLIPAGQSCQNFAARHTGYLPRLLLIDASARVALRSFLAARFKNLGVRCVPFAASHEGLFSVSFGENGRSELIFQSRKSALSGPPTHESGRHSSPTRDARKLSTKTPVSCARLPWLPCPHAGSNQIPFAVLANSSNSQTYSVCRVPTVGALGEHLASCL